MAVGSSVATADGTEINEWRLILVLVLATAIGPFSMQVFLPALPAIQSSYGVAAATAQLAFSLSAFAMAVATLFYGPISDRVGRRRALLDRHHHLHRGLARLRVRHLDHLADHRPHRPGRRRRRRHGLGASGRPRRLRSRALGLRHRLHHHGHGGGTDAGAGDRRRPDRPDRLEGGLHGRRRARCAGAPGRAYRPAGDSRADQPADHRGRHARRLHSPAPRAGLCRLCRAGRLLDGGLLQLPGRGTLRHDHRARATALGIRLDVHLDLGLVHGRQLPRGEGEPTRRHRADDRHGQHRHRRRRCLDPRCSCPWSTPPPGRSSCR